MIYTPDSYKFRTPEEKEICEKLAESENVKYFKSTKIKIDILSEHKRESDIDGEKGPDLPLEITILPRHLTVISGKD